MRRFEAIVFDMDGVLVDSEPLHFRAAKAVIAEDGKHLPWEVYVNYVGTTTETTWTDFRRRLDLPASYDDYVRRYDAAVIAVLAEPLERLPGVTKTIEAARSNGLRLALASSSQMNWIEATLRGLRLDDAFEIIVSGEQVEHGKPAPDIYTEAARRLGLPAERCIAIEDSPSGVRSAKAAGLGVVAVRTHYVDEAELAPADMILNTLEDLDLALLD